MKKTTIYLPEDLKRKIEKLARKEGQSEAELIREVLALEIGRRTAPKPRIPLFKTLGDPTVAGRVDELLDGFGE